MDEVIRQALGLQVPVRQVTKFTPGGRLRTGRPGERVILGPDGRPIRVVTDELGATVVETDDSRHVHVRPRIVGRPG